MYRTRGVILFCAVMLNGCSFLHVKVPVSAETEIPTGTATSWVDVRKKLQHLQECIKNDEQLDGSQLTITHVFQYLNITETTPGVREFVTATQKQESIYGKNTFIYLHSLEEK